LLNQQFQRLVDMKDHVKKLHKIHILPIKCAPESYTTGGAAAEVSSPMISSLQSSEPPQQAGSTN
jgi:hypothetical protein